MKPYNELTMEEKVVCISLYPEEAKRDGNGYIRLWACRVLGFTDEAREDKDPDIRREAEIYFNVKNGGNIL